MSDAGTILGRLDLWTGTDTAEGGPTLADCETVACVEPAEGGAMLHITSIDADGNLWTIALYLNRADAEALARDLNAVALFKTEPGFAEYRKERDATSST